MSLAAALSSGVVLGLGYAMARFNRLSTTKTTTTAKGDTHRERERESKTRKSGKVCSFGLLDIYIYIGRGSSKFAKHMPLTNKQIS